MKKYVSSGTSAFAFASVICILLILAGVLLIILAPWLFNWILLCFSMGIPLGVLFSVLWLTCSRNYLLLDDTKLVLPITRAPKLRFKRHTIPFDKIQYIQVMDYKGDRILSEDTKFYHFVLTDGLEFTQTLSPHYGKKAEQEIVDRLKAHVRFI